MKQHLYAMLPCLGLALAGSAEADGSGWFLEQPTAERVELGADLLARNYAIAGQPLLSLSAGYRFNDSFSLQARVREVVSDTGYRLSCMDSDFACLAARHRSPDEALSYTLSLMPAFLLHDDLAVYGRLGIQGWDVQANGDPNVKKSELLFGVGVGYDISNPLRLQLEYRSMDLDIKLTSIGFSWRF